MKNDNINHIGNRIKDRRKKMALTINDMCLYTGLSAGHLSNIERNQTSPTLSNLKLICEVLRISISDMLKDVSEEKIVVRRNEIQIKEYPEYNQTLKLIDFGRDNDLYEILIIYPGQPETLLECMHPYDEACTVIKGSVVVILDGERHVLNKEDSIYIKAHSKHIFSNESEKNCEIWTYKRSL